jgi:hypothetical protein
MDNASNISLGLRQYDRLSTLMSCYTHTDAKEVSMLSGYASATMCVSDRAAGDGMDVGHSRMLLRLYHERHCQHFMHTHTGHVLRQLHHRLRCSRFVVRFLYYVIILFCGRNGKIVMMGYWMSSRCTKAALLHRTYPSPRHYLHVLITTISRVLCEFLLPSLSLSHIVDGTAVEQ